MVYGLNTKHVSGSDTELYAARAPSGIFGYYISIYLLTIPVDCVMHPSKL